MIRRATIDDAFEIARLCGQLGYPAQKSTLEKRLSLLLNMEHHKVFVMEENRSVVGWIQGAVVTTVEYDQNVEIMGLVVDNAHRRKGIAKALVEEIVKWATKDGYPRVRVRSNLAREESHVFYKSIGFIKVKQQQVYDLPVIPASYL